MASVSVLQIALIFFAIEHSTSTMVVAKISGMFALVLPKRFSHYVLLFPEKKLLQVTSGVLVLEVLLICL